MSRRRKIRRMDFHFDNWLVGTRDMKPGVRGNYIQICALIGSHNAPIDDDASEIAGWCGCTPTYARKVIDLLIAEGKLYRDEHGRLGNARVDDELGAATGRVDRAQTASGLRVHAKSTRSPRGVVSSRINGLAAQPDHLTSNHQPTILTPYEGVKSQRAVARPPQVTGAGAAVSRGTLIPDDWQPSDETVAKLRRSRPDLVGSHYDLELLKFRMWAQANAVLTHRIEASFIGFMIKARLPSRQTEEERDAEFQRVLRSLKEKRQ